MIHNVDRRYMWLGTIALALVLALGVQARGEACASTLTAAPDLGPATPTPTSTPPTGEVYTYLTQWGSYGQGNGQFSYPNGMALDSVGNIYVADTNNYRIEKFASTRAYLSQWGSGGSGNGQFILPSGVAVDTAGIVYVADSNNDRIEKFTSDGTYLSQWGSSGSRTPTRILNLLPTSPLYAAWRLSWRARTAAVSAVSSGATAPARGSSRATTRLRRSK